MLRLFVTHYLDYFWKIPIMWKVRELADKVWVLSLYLVSCLVNFIWFRVISAKSPSCCKPYVLFVTYAHYNVESYFHIRSKVASLYPCLFNPIFCPFNFLTLGSIKERTTNFVVFSHVGLAYAFFRIILIISGVVMSL